MVRRLASSPSTLVVGLSGYKKLRRHTVAEELHLVADRLQSLEVDDSPAAQPQMR